MYFLVLFFRSRCRRNKWCIIWMQNWLYICNLANSLDHYLSISCPLVPTIPTPKHSCYTYHFAITVYCRISQVTELDQIAVDFVLIWDTCMCLSFAHFSITKWEYIFHRLRQSKVSRTCMAKKSKVENQNFPLRRIWKKLDLCL